MSARNSRIVALLAAAHFLGANSVIYCTDAGAEEETVPTTLKRIPISLIRENKTALRPVNRGSDSYKEMLQSVKNEGVLQTILVRESTDPETQQTFYGLVDGLHRLTCAKDAGFTHLDCKVVASSDIDVLRRQMIMNYKRIDMKPVQATKQFQRMMNADSSLTVAELAKQVCMTPEFIYNRLGLLDLDQRVAAEVDSGRIPLLSAYALAKIEDQTEQFDQLQNAIQMTSAEFVPMINERVAKLRADARKGKDSTPVAWAPIARLRKPGEIKEERENPRVGKQLLKDFAGTAEEAFALAINWCMHMDPGSVAIQKQKEDARVKEKAAAKEKADAEREAKKLAEAAKIAVAGDK